MTAVRRPDSDTTGQHSESAVQVITPRTGWLDIDLPGIWRYRDLVWLLVRRDFVTLYKQTILGPLWAVIQPLANSIVFAIIFGHVAKLPTDGVPPFLFYLAGTVPWVYFASSLSATSNTFVTNAALFGKVYFPRAVVPLSVVISNLFSATCQYAVLLVVLAYYSARGADIQPSWLIIFAPLLFIHIAVLALACGLIVSAMTSRYRDLALAINFCVTLWMYATPIVYPLSQVPERWQWAFALNPMTGVIELFRIVHLGAGALTLAQYLVSLGVTGCLVVFGLLIFSRVERSFIDTV